MTGKGKAFWGLLSHMSMFFYVFFLRHKVTQLISTTLMSTSHYRWYIPRWEGLLSGGTTSKDATYLRRLGVSFTLQAEKFVVIGIGRVLQQPSEVCVCDLLTQWWNVHLPPVTLCRHVTPKDDWVTTLYTLWTTPSVGVARNSYAHAHNHLRMLTVRQSEAEILKYLKTTVECTR